MHIFYFYLEENSIELLGTVIFIISKANINYRRKPSNSEFQITPQLLMQTDSFDKTIISF